MQRSFDHHSVHAEFNRHGIYPKEIEFPDAEGVLTVARVFPDIIVHQPGHDDENLLVIEAKKTTNSARDDEDIAKLVQIKRPLEFQFAAFLRLPAGENAALEDLRIIWA